MLITVESMRYPELYTRPTEGWRVSWRVVERRSYYYHFGEIRVYMVRRNHDVVKKLSFQYVDMYRNDTRIFCQLRDWKDHMDYTRLFDKIHSLYWAFRRWNWTIRAGDAEKYNGDEQGRE